MNFIIRKANLNDVEKLAEIYIETWQATYPGMISKKILSNMSTKKEIKAWSQLINDDHLILVLENNEKIIGFISGGAHYEKEYFEIGALYILPNYQNRGGGKALLNKMFSELKLNYNSVIISVLASNPSRFFYEKIGGKIHKIVTRKRHEIGNSKEIDYVWSNITHTLEHELKI